MAGQEPLGREYLLHEEIGRGAMAVVRRATSRHGGVPLAAKLLRPELAGDRRVRELFLREEAALRALDHPSIVRLRDLIVEGGTLALVMEFVDGPHLRRYLSMRGGRLTPGEVVTVAAQVAAALAAAHEHGVVHLDLKPENILVRRGSTPPEIRITDFGVAVLLNDADRGAAGGTPGYTAPEIFQGAAPTPAADVWSLGVLLLEMTTGRATGDPSALPGPLGPVARDCLAADPRRRPPARRVAAYLRQFAVGASFGGTGTRPAPAPVPGFSGPPGPATGFSGPPGPATGFSGPPGPVVPAADHDPEPATLPLGFPPPQLPPPQFPPPAPPQPPRAAFVTPGPPAAPGQRDTIGTWAGRLPGTGPYDPAPAPPREPSRWRRGPLITLAAAVVAAAVMAGVTMTASAGERSSRLVTQVSVPPKVSPVEATGSPAPAATLPPTTEVALPPLNTPSAERLRVTLAGKVEDDAGTLAISIRDGVAIAYVCDGDRLEVWLKGTAQNGLLNLTGKKESRITGLFDARRAAGELTVQGATHRFEIGVVRKPSGLYRLAGRVGGASVDGGWIVLADGTQVGVLSRAEVPGPAPRLDVATRTTTIDGETVTGTSVDAETGEGF
ncbi:protein kinase domain-containing protein [Actinoplanes flavus]|uniref:non-specific serine/threonine protein kinase n=1 Tax=Actinoplanes flavus TaxID=2820290 RepID=A0ABS3UVD1_9ACTN|nr:serine/threonine-protein kinase [Actinoplanes flavus]MBO3742546.1 protein kinase [Actinoplanes flavus]